MPSAKTLTRPRAAARGHPLRGAGEGLPGRISDVPHRHRCRRHVYRSRRDRRRSARRCSPRCPRPRTTLRSASSTASLGWPGGSASNARALLARDRAHRPRHHGRDQRAPRTQGRKARAADHRRAIATSSRCARASRTIATICACRRPSSWCRAICASGCASGCAPTAASRRRSIRPRSTPRSRVLRDERVEAVAVCYLHAWRDPTPRTGDARRR